MNNCLPRLTLFCNDLYSTTTCGNLTVVKNFRRSDLVRDLSLHKVDVANEWKVYQEMIYYSNHIMQ